MVASVLWRRLDDVASSRRSTGADVPGMYRRMLVTHYPEVHTGKWVTGPGGISVWRRCASVIAAPLAPWVRLDEIDEKSPTCIACIALGPRKW